jgi:hypothetical protein
MFTNLYFPVIIDGLEREIYKRSALKCRQQEGTKTYYYRLQIKSEVGLFIWTGSLINNNSSRINSINIHLLIHTGVR